MDNIKSYRIKKTTLIIAISIIFSLLLFDFLFGQRDQKVKEFVIDNNYKPLRIYDNKYNKSTTKSNPMSRYNIDEQCN